MRLSVTFLLLYRPIVVVRNVRSDAVALSLNHLIRVDRNSYVFRRRYNKMNKSHFPSHEQKTILRRARERT